MSINVKALVERRTSEAFPNILIDNPSQALPAVVSSLEEGDMQLIVELGGERKVVKRISQSAMNVDKLLRTVGTIKYVMGPNVFVDITDVSTYLDCF